MTTWSEGFEDAPRDGAYVTTENTTLDQVVGLLRFSAFDPHTGAFCAEPDESAGAAVKVGPLDAAGWFTFNYASGQATYRYTLDGFEGVAVVAADDWMAGLRWTFTVTAPGMPATTSPAITTPNHWVELAARAVGDRVTFALADETTTYGTWTSPEGYAPSGDVTHYWTPTAGRIDDLSVNGNPPPRRTYPRDDALSGGAPRTWPPSRAYQSSNRIHGGYL